MRYKYFNLNKILYSDQLNLFHLNVFTGNSFIIEITNYFLLIYITCNNVKFILALFSMNKCRNIHYFEENKRALWACKSVDYLPRVKQLYFFHLQPLAICFICFLQRTILKKTFGVLKVNRVLNNPFIRLSTQNPPPKKLFLFKN